MTTDSSRAHARWRTADIVVCAVIGVAFGVVFWAWNLLWAAAGPAFTGFPPLQAFMYGTWLLPAVVAPLIIRRPGAAVFAETVAATVSALLGAQWGLLTIVYGLMQGGAAELVFAFTLYRAWNLPVALGAAAAAGVAAWLLDVAIFYEAWA
ncbi:MAG TPA: ECF transporter S component, partial [Candidatus Limnocylindrales bacterium]|nr:ECF transporter S component [Candidatus Limnocylindrales bacterium]